MAFIGNTVLTTALLSCKIRLGTVGQAGGMSCFIVRHLAIISCAKYLPAPGYKIAKSLPTNDFHFFARRE